MLSNGIQILHSIEKDCIIKFQTPMEVEQIDKNNFLIKNSSNIFDDRHTITDLIYRAIKDYHCDNLNAEKLTKKILYYIYGDEK